MAFDSVQPAPPVVLREAEGLSRPLIGPDGGTLLFTEAGKMHVMDLRTRALGTLGDGFAIAVLRDPASGADWVYAAESDSGDRLFRFSLDTPERREPFWDAARVDPHTVQISRDGKMFAAAFFGRDMGVADVAGARWRKLITQNNACLAPDNSYVSGFLDGTRRRLRLFLPNGDPRDPVEQSPGPVTWQVELPTLAALAGRDATAVRWSNHPRFLVITSSEGNGHGRIGVARFSADLRTLEGGAFLQTASGEVSEPDAWVGGGQTAALPDFAQSPPLEAPVIQIPAQRWLRWPRTYEGAEFLWSDDFSNNHLPGRREPCRVHPHGYGRFDEWGSMRLDGGTFEADIESARAFAEAAAKKNEFSLELVLSESIDQRAPFSTRLLALQLDENRDAFSLSRVDQSLVLRVLLDAADGSAPREYQAVLGPIAITNNQAFHLGLTVREGEVVWNFDGEAFPGNTSLGPASLAAWRSGVRRLVFGDAEQQGSAGWRGRLDHVLLRCGPVEWTESRDNTANALRFGPERKLTRVQRIRAKLSEMPLANPRDPRALVQQTYDVVEVISGKFDQPRLAVLHWAVLDGRPVPSRPAQAGGIFELQVVPADRHSQLESERIHLSPHDFQLPLYFDATPPSTHPVAAHEKK
ncbi:MAG: hypothetical protein ACR2OZ_18425 [Verrucomicrobiales bacterium]